MKDKLHIGPRGSLGTKCPRGSRCPCSFLEDSGGPVVVLFARCCCLAVPGPVAGENRLRLQIRYKNFNKIYIINKIYMSMVDLILANGSTAHSMYLYVHRGT